MGELFEAEKGLLLELPPVPFSNLHTRDGKVDSYATVIVDKNRYSVPTRYVGLKVIVNLYVEHLEIFYAGKKIAVHQRVYGNNKWQLDPDHYLELIQQRPGAFQEARPIRQWRQSWPPALERLLARFQESQGDTAGIKDFINVLLLYREHPGEAIRAAVELALENNLSSSQGVKHLLLQIQSGPEFAPVVVLLVLLFAAYEIGLFGHRERPAKSASGKPKEYPRIIGSDGVWVNEIKDFDNAYVQYGPDTCGWEKMETAKRHCKADDR